jgi:pyruvate, orthophosphate dikinase
MNAQGEDVVSGVRTPLPISELERAMPKVYDHLRAITWKMEKHYRDMQDFEFTIQDGKLYMLQTRNGKRTGLAAVRIAIDMVAKASSRRKKPSSASSPTSSTTSWFPA